MSHLQGRFEGLICKVGIVPSFGRPVQIPAKVSKFFLDGGILQAGDVIVVILFPIAFLLTGCPEGFVVSQISNEFC